MNNDKNIKILDNKDFHVVSLLTSMGGYFIFPSLLYTTMLLGTRLIAPGTPVLDITIKIFATCIAEIPLVILLVYFSQKILKNDYEKFKGSKLAHILLVVGGFVAIFFANILVNFVYTKLGISTTSANEQAISQMLANKYSPLVLVGVVFFAPLIEEFIFRKFLFGVIEEKLNWKPIVSILISSVLFAFVHLLAGGDVEWQFFLMYFPMAIILSLSYHFSNKNIFVPMTIHFLNNLMASVFSLLPAGVLWLSMIN